MSQPDYLNELYDKLKEVGRDLDENQRNIYILSGVFGGACLVLLVAVIALAVALVRTNKQIKNMKTEKRVEQEMNAQKYAAYTGEEMHRKMIASNPIASAGINQRKGTGPESEYAFNAPFVDNRLVSTPSRPPSFTGSKLNRF